MPVLLDFESRSRVPLKGPNARTSRQYWQHVSSQALCAAWYDTRTQDAGVWVPGDVWPHQGRILGAHNWCGFDRFAADALGWRYSGWVDTSHLARKAGLPGALDALCERWLGRRKDEEGSALVQRMSSIRCPPRPSHCSAASWRAWWKALDDDDRRRYGVQPEMTPEIYRRIVEYNVSDVEPLAEAWPRLSEWRDVDRDVELVDAAINDRGVLFDTELAQLLLHIDEALGDQVCEEVAQELHLPAADVRAQAKSTQQFIAATGAPNAQALTVAQLDHPLARARQTLATIAQGKLNAGLRLANSDGRLRDAHLYYGGHTGRWSQKGMQLHNLPRPAKWLEGVDPDPIAAQLLDGQPAAQIVRALPNSPDTVQALGDLVSCLVRATLTASPGKLLVAADFAQVEGRGNAWLAGDHDALRVYTSDADPYKVAAAAIYGVGEAVVTKPQRQIGKCAELACGYGGGPGAFAQIARGNRVSLDGLSSGARQQIVDAWRRLHAPIVRFWRASETAFRRVVDGKHSAWSQVFQFVASTDGKDVCAFLPSGRPIVYNDVRLSPDARRRPRITYRPAGEDVQRAAPFCPVCVRKLDKAKFCDCGSPLRTSGQCPSHGEVQAMRKCPAHGLVFAELRADTYGGKLVENLVQAFCRDLMADALVRAERAGLCPVLTVHDEIVCEVDAGQANAGLAELLNTMKRLPKWAAGFPLDADGWVGERYRK